MRRAAWEKSEVAVPRDNAHSKETGMSFNTRFAITAVAAALGAALTINPAFAQKKYDTGATDTEIKIGQTMPYSGPASAYGTIGKVEAAYFNKINEEGG